MSRVFVVQNQHRWDGTLGQFVPKFDLSPAQVFGDIVPLLSPTASPFNLGSILGELRSKLSDFRDDDYILCVGNPILIALTFAIAADVNGGTATALQWSGKDRRYLPVGVTDLFGPEDQ
ncbi:hypothetical protein CPT_Sonora_033 [Stenotrophomonas phage Sonora]|nr:hypothetical protein CPT_Sonora_033 [Stenotrophomonas phage Sonora]